MKTITHEGKEYILKEEVDGIVRERLSKVTEAKRQAESRANLLESQISDMESKVKNTDAMASQLAQLRDELAVSNQRYERHSAIANHGITDPEIRDLVEWQFSKAMEGKPKKDQVSLATWLGGMKEGGEVPVVLKPYLGEVSSPAAETGTASQPAQPAQPSQAAQPATASTLRTMPPMGT
jgi:TolA-binding protein